jgi:hypothetical protein
MKKIISILTFTLFFSLLSQAQGQFWEEDYTFEAIADQADGGSVSVDITNTGLDIEECKKKARSQALFTIIFKGYPKTNNASASTALADMANFNQNLDFYKNYLTSNTAGLGFINNYQTNMSKPGGKIDKKTIRTTTTVYIMKGKLKEDLQAQGMIKSAANIAKSMGITPSILIIPSEEWMKSAGYAKKETTDIGEVTIYDWQNALNDPKMAIFISIQNYLNKPLQDNGFRIGSLSSIMQDLQKEMVQRSATKLKAQEDPTDILARVASADIWLSVNLLEEKVSGGQEKQYQLSFTGIDPILGEKKINMNPIIKKTSSDNDMVLIENSVNIALDQFIPELTKFFSSRDQEGLPGKVEFALAEDLDFNFSTEIEDELGTLTISELMENILGENTIYKQQIGAATSTYMFFDAKIPSKFENKRTGKTEMNTYKQIGSKLRNEIKNKLKDKGVTAEVESRGLGKIKVIIKKIS